MNFPTSGWLGDKSPIFRCCREPGADLDVWRTSASVWPALGSVTYHVVIIRGGVPFKLRHNVFCYFHADKIILSQHLFLYLKTSLEKVMKPN